VVSEAVKEAHSNGSRAAVVALQVIFGAFTPLALISVGGVGIYAAPLLLPLLWISANGAGGLDVGTSQSELRYSQP
jgi:hypothetical protein